MTKACAATSPCGAPYAVALFIAACFRARVSPCGGCFHLFFWSGSFGGARCVFTRHGTMPANVLTVSMFVPAPWLDFRLVKVWREIGDFRALGYVGGCVAR